MLVLAGIKLAKGDNKADTTGNPVGAESPTVTLTNTPPATPTVPPMVLPTEIPVRELTLEELQEGENIFIYSMGAKGVLAAPAQKNRINPANANIFEDYFETGNGARVFTVEKNGEYYRFYNTIDGYLCAKGTGNNAYYSRTANEEADWRIEAGNGGFYLQNRVAKYQTFPQYLEYYSGLITSYSMNNPKDYDIFTFLFFSAGDLTGAVNKPLVSYGRTAEAEKGVAYEFKFQVEATYEIKELYVTLEQNALSYTLENGSYKVYIPAEFVTGKMLNVHIYGTDAEQTAFQDEIRINVVDEPVFSKQTPAKAEQTGEEKLPEISVEVKNAGERPAITMMVDGKAVYPAYRDGKIVYTPEKAFPDGRVKVVVQVTRTEDFATASTSWSFTVGEPQYELYFGQLHSHTDYSDGSGTLKSALDYIYKLSEKQNVDFVAFTDHSNYFDKYGGTNPEGALYDLDLATETSRNMWLEYTETIDAFNEKQDKVVALGGFEMTWSNGPGHINTFNTEGIVSRNNQTLNEKDGYAGLQAYYALLSEDAGAGSISQFNHPGEMFGTFNDFDFWDKKIDDRIQLIEVSNGSGAVGGSNYFPSYEYYDMALSKGWHLAPTMNQDNHGGRWGNSNEARTVVLAEDLTEDAIYDAIYNRRVYATEDRNLEVYYTLNDRLFGSVLTELPSELNMRVQFTDPDTTDRVVRVEVVAESGKTIYEWTDTSDLADGVVETALQPEFSYYYIRITQADGNLAFTAPVWVETE